MADSSPLPGDGDASKPAFTMLDRFPATPAGHVAFLEWVSSEIHGLAESKRRQRELGYGDDTLRGTLRGIKQCEAWARFAELTDLPDEVRKVVNDALQRKWTIYAVEQIDELLTQPVRELRDSLECLRAAETCAIDGEGGREVDIADEAIPISSPDGAASDPLAERMISEETQTREDDTPAELAGNSATPMRPKRSTVRGEGREKLIAALTLHHQYADGGCLNLVAIGNNELARLASVAESTASAFFNREFNRGEKGGYAKYRSICHDAGRLTDSLKALNGEFSPHELYGRRPPGEAERDDEE